MKKNIREKFNAFFESTIETLLAFLSIALDAAFWVGWAYVTHWSSEFINSLEISPRELWPYTIAQWAGCGVLAVFALVKTEKIAFRSMTDFFAF